MRPSFSVLDTHSKLTCVNDVFGILVPPVSGTPQPIVMPITIVGVLALLFGKWIIPELTSPWDEGSETVFSE